MEREYAVCIAVQEGDAELWDITDFPEDLKQSVRNCHGKVIGSDLEADEARDKLWDDQGNPRVKVKNLWNSQGIPVSGKVYWFGLLS